MASFMSIYSSDLNQLSCVIQSDVSGVVTGLLALACQGLHRPQVHEHVQ